MIGTPGRLLCVALASLLAACAGLPPRPELPVSVAPADTGDTRLGQAIAPLLAEQPGLSGIYPLAEGKGALAARVLLAEGAGRTLDVQYYIWHGDESGLLLMDELRKAADRGVHVRLLVDDNGVEGLDELLAALDAHPDVEVRLYNPFANRGARWLGFLTDFDRLNRRMHNKSFTADGQATIVGGRNVGNEYFAAGQEVSFADLDVLAIGPAVRDVTRAFDEYWNSASAWPAEALLDVADASPRAVADAAYRLADRPETIAYVQALRATGVVRDLLAGGLPFEWATTRLVCDSPAKTLGGTQDDGDLLLGQLVALVGEPRRQFLLVSPYFVPMEDGTRNLVAMAARGVEVSVLTNSLAATDVAAVHAGYAKRREDLLRGGVRLFELKRAADAESGNTIAGSSGASLHAKTFAVDGERVFVGSFNFDPRSARINTEMGLVIDSPALAGRLARSFDDDVPKIAYEAVLDDRGDLGWIERDGGGERRLSSEPDAGFFRRLSAWFAGLLPVESQL